MSNDGMYLVTDDDGRPIAFFDKGQIDTDGVRFAFELAAACADEDAVDAVVTETLTRVGVDGFGYVAAAALSVMVKEILAPTLVITDKIGIDLRTMLHSMAAGETPGGAT